MPHGSTAWKKRKISGTVWRFAGPAKYKTKDGYPLGKWINNARKRRNDGKLTEERIRQLDQMGMIWSVFDAKWEQGYAFAAVYAQDMEIWMFHEIIKQQMEKRLVAGFKIKN